MIFDAFIFFNELELLEIRLNTLDKEVDYFVIVESKKTFTFKDKPLYYEQNKHLFEKFNHKIIHVPMDFGGRGEWGNEFAQRNFIREGLKDAKDDDIIILSDVDEIPNLKDFRKFEHIITDEDIVAFPMQYYYYYLNLEMSLKQNIIKAFKYKHLQNNSPQDMRGKQENYVWEKMGWHFSYMGGPERISEKMNAFAHQDMNIPFYNNENHIKARLERNEDLFNRGYSFTEVSLDNLPKYVQKNKDKFKHLLK